MISISIGIRLGGLGNRFARLFRSALGGARILRMPRISDPNVTSGTGAVQINSLPTIS